MEKSLEQKFLGWYSSHQDRIQDFTLPRELFSQQGFEIFTDIRNGKSFTQSEPSSTDEALEYLQDQILLFLGREVGKSRRTHDVTKIHSAIALLEECQSDAIHLPIADFAESTPEVRTFIPTGIDLIDQQIRGLAKGELGVIALSPGRGKTAFLINFAYSALSLSKSVLYITVADAGVNELVPRIDSCILGTPLSDPLNQQLLLKRHGEALRRINGKLMIADFTDRECSLEDLRKVIRNTPADLCIVDHADDVVPPYGDPSVTRHSLRTTYLTLKKFSVEFHIPIWTASQTSELAWSMRSASTSELSEAKVGKTTGAAIVLVGSGGLPRDQIPGVMWITIAKARRSFTERTFAIRYDWGVGRIW